MLLYQEIWTAPSKIQLQLTRNSAVAVKGYTQRTLHWWSIKDSIVISSSQSPSHVNIVIRFICHSVRWKCIFARIRYLADALYVGSLSVVHGCYKVIFVRTLVRNLINVQAATEHLPTVRICELIFKPILRSKNTSVNAVQRHSPACHCC